MQYESAAHRVQSPPAGPEKPGLHWHWDAEVAPDEDVLLFDGQLLEEVAELVQNEPIGHKTAVETPGAQYEPDGQLVATPFKQNVPAAQVAGADDMGKHTEPLGQAVAAAAPAGQKNCVGHAAATPF